MKRGKAANVVASVRFLLHLYCIKWICLEKKSTFFTHKRLFEMDGYSLETFDIVCFVFFLCVI